MDSLKIHHLSNANQYYLLHVICSGCSKQGQNHKNYMLKASLTPHFLCAIAYYLL